jgi:hypothetical protein
MLSHEVNKAISVRQRLKCTALDWTLQKRDRVCHLEGGMLGRHMELQSLL